MPKVAFSGFAWDEANRRKCQSHGVSISEIEYVLAQAESVMVSDIKNSQRETRFIAIGRTQKGRYTFVVFTPRKHLGATLLRPISARYMHRKEVDKYEQEIARAEKR
jgi:uncharacterized DUF497 family protein